MRECAVQGCHYLLFVGPLFRVRSPNKSESKLFKTIAIGVDNK